MRVCVRGRAGVRVLSSLVCMVGIIYVYIDTVFELFFVVVCFFVCFQTA